MTSGEISIVFGEHSLTAKGGDSFLTTLSEKWWSQIDLSDIKKEIIEDNLSENFESTVKTKNTPKKKITRNKSRANDIDSEEFNAVITAIKGHPSIDQVKQLMVTAGALIKFKLVCYLAGRGLSVVMVENLLSKVFRLKPVITLNALRVGISRDKDAEFEFEIKDSYYKLTAKGIKGVEDFISTAMTNADK
jgi:hypothetical protein